MFSSLFKLASATVRTNVAIGGCRCYPRSNLIGRVSKDKTTRVLQENVEEIEYDYREEKPIDDDYDYRKEEPPDYDYRQESSGYNERKGIGKRSSSSVINPKYRKQYQQNIGRFHDDDDDEDEFIDRDEDRDRRGIGKRSSSSIINPKNRKQYQQNIERFHDDDDEDEFKDRERRGIGKRSSSGVINPKYRKQYQQNIGQFDDDDDEDEFKDRDEDDEQFKHGDKEVVELSPDDVVPIHEEYRTVAKEQELVSRKKKKKKKETQQFYHDRTGIVEIGENIFKYKVLGRDTKDLGKEVLECKSSRMRELNQKIILEGKRLIYDAIEANVRPLKIFFTRTEDLKKFKLPLNVELYKNCYEDLQVFSNVKTSQGILGVFQMPSLESLQPSPGTFPLTIICDQIREPGNMGSIIRVAAGVGCSKLILTKGCVDVWDAKVLRSAAGAHFRIPIIKSLTWEEIPGKLPEDYSLFLADSEKPSEPDEESAGEVKSPGAAFKNKYMVSDNVPLGAYHSQNYWRKESVVLVIGGETIGLSLNAYQLAIDKIGKRIYIPLSNGVESLNSGVALSVLSYEIRKQYFSEKTEEKQEQLSNNETYQSVGLYSE